MLTIFKEENGLVSMRRVLAFILVLSGIVAGFVSVLTSSAWQVVAACFGIPEIGAIILLFFTTWSDVADVVAKVKNQGQ